MGLPTPEALLAVMQEVRTSSPYIAFFMYRDKLSYEDAVERINRLPNVLSLGSQNVLDGIQSDSEKAVLYTMAKYQLNRDEALVILDARELWLKQRHSYPTPLQIGGWQTNYSSTGNPFLAGGTYGD